MHINYGGERGRDFAALAAALIAHPSLTQLTLSNNHDAALGPVELAVVVDSALALRLTTLNFGMTEYV
jgi:hypothetical protein